MIRITASAPGKLILCGEHAVVYRRPALVAAVDLRLRSTLEVEESASGGPAATPLRSDAPVRLRVPLLGLDETVSWGEVREYAAAARQRWRDWAESTAGPGSQAFATVRSDDPAHVLKVALGETAADLGESGGPPLSLTVESDLPIGSGFGSSAAAAVTVVAGYRALRASDRPSGSPNRSAPGHSTPEGRAPESEEQRRIERLALEVERRQHGSPSGVDGAAVLHGGLLWAERRAGDGGLEFRPFAGGAGGAAVLRRLSVFDTGTPAEGTGAVVAAVRNRAAAEPEHFAALWDEVEDVTRAFRALLESPPASDAEVDRSLATLIRRSQRALEDAGVVPEAVRQVVAAVETAGGSAKISGAGSLAGPGAGSLIVHHPDAAVLDGLAALGGLRRHRLRLGGSGLRVEVDAPAATESASAFTAAATDASTADAGSLPRRPRTLEDPP